MLSDTRTLGLAERPSACNSPLRNTPLQSPPKPFLTRKTEPSTARTPRLQPTHYPAPRTQPQPQPNPNTKSRKPAARRLSGPLLRSTNLACIPGTRPAIVPACKASRHFHEEESGAAGDVMMGSGTRGARIYTCKWT